MSGSGTGSVLTLRTGVWVSDERIELPVPTEWEVDVLRPRTPAPLGNDRLEAALDLPLGRPSIEELCKGKSRPVVIVDDLNRPTPVSRILPSVLARIEKAGIPKHRVTIVMATGSHGLPKEDAWVRKIGPEAASSCRLRIHDCFRDARSIGKTRSGTPVSVNRAVLQGDVVMGIGGIYPNRTAGLGGGSKLALGVLGLRTIYALHTRHGMSGWGSSGVDNAFRRDLDEIAEMIGMSLSISVILDGDRNIVRIDCGDSRRYFPDAARYYFETFRTRGPAGADVVISNAYPNDLSLTFARAKGFEPLAGCSPGASRISVASCSDGIGLHNIFPFVNKPRFHRVVHPLRRIACLPPGEAVAKGVEKAGRVLAARLRRKATTGHQPREGPTHPVWLYRPGDPAVALPPRIPGVRVASSWPDVVETVRTEQGGRKGLRVTVYPCAFLQIF